MNSKIKVIALSLALFSFAACQQNANKEQNGSAQNGSSTTSNVVAKDVKTVTDFKEGVINVKITTPGSAIGELLQKVDPAKGNISAQMKALTEKLSAKDRLLLETQSKKNGMLNLAILMLPLQSTLYLKGNEATAKFDAVTFHGENYVDDGKKTGLMYVKSQNSANEMTIRYTGDSFKEMNTNQLDAADYDIVKTNETAEVAGYPCTKMVYTLKNAAKAQKTKTGMPGASGKVYKIDVWTSAQMPKSINFLHPLYVKEAAGIMKLVIQYEKALDFKILYELNHVESRAVTPNEMAIKQSKPVYDFGKDKMTVGFKMMGVIFGM